MSGAQLPNNSMQRTALRAAAEPRHCQTIDGERAAIVKSEERAWTT